MLNTFSRRWLHGAWIVVPVLGLGACDFTVTNPGPVEDAFLAEPTAHASLVNGAGRNLSLALDAIAYTTGAITREIHPAGSTGTYGITVRQQQGLLHEDETGGYWTNGHRARWTAEDGARRIRTALGADAEKSPLLAQILVWGGYANRLLGESFCETALDGGALQPVNVHFTRADSLFSDAIRVATAANQPNLVTAARAGRASVRMYLGNWTGAVADAQTVPTAFRYQMPYYNTEIALYNEVYESSAGTFRAHTVWNTFYEKYYTDTKDPRTPWSRSATQPTGDAAVLNLGRVPWYFQQKYTSRSSPINLASGREMRLIEAEAKLRDGDWASALATINTLRTSIGMAPWTATNATEAWTRLKRERGIELWLEARRLGDLRRWKESSTPGALDVLETPGTASNLTSQSLCYPIPLIERQTNPNL